MITYDVFGTSRLDRATKCESNSFKIQGVHQWPKIYLEESRTLDNLITSPTNISSPDLGLYFRAISIVRSGRIAFGMATE